MLQQDTMKEDTQFLPTESDDGHAVENFEAFSETFAKIADYQVLDKHGKSFALSSIYECKKVVLVFLRHFACYACRDFVIQLGKTERDYRAKMQGNNVKIVAIGCGAPSCIDAFAKDTQFEGEIYTDPGRKIHMELGLNSAKSMYQLLCDGPRKHPYAATDLWSGLYFGISRMISTKFCGGDIHQLGAELLVDNGQVHYVVRLVKQGKINLQAFEGYITKYATIPWFLLHTSQQHCPSIFKYTLILSLKRSNLPTLPTMLITMIHLLKLSIMAKHLDISPFDLVNIGKLLEMTGIHLEN